MPLLDVFNKSKKSYISGKIVNKLKKKIFPRFFSSNNCFRIISYYLLRERVKKICKVEVSMYEENVK